MKIGGVTISEIKTIFTYKSLGKLLSLENKNYFKGELEF